jgi:asparagine synthase (glutamine-hydrolysing)
VSGIAGIIRFDGASVEPGLVEKMTAAMPYRGPDGIHHWVKGSVALGQCMLRTTPESLEEKQPLCNEDESLVLVMDGRVDNWEELRRELLGCGARLRDRSDAELVLKAYETWGQECVSHIDGDFALVVWDERKRTAFCARDRMGCKPFNYRWDGTTFVFASEPHAILALPWIGQEVNEGVLAEFLADEWYSRDETLWKGIDRLVAAHAMAVDASGPHITQYWEVDLWEELPYRKDEEFIEHYRHLFADTVRRLSRSHRAVAYEVSGGLDSSAVFCTADMLLRTGRLPSPGINGYTMAFADDAEANEIAYARAVGEHVGKAIQEIAPESLPLTWYVKRAERYRNFPGYPNGGMHAGLSRKAALDGATVLMTGLGGDQFLQGSRAYYFEEFAQSRWGQLAACFNADAQRFGAMQAVGWLVRYGLYPMLPAAARMAIRKLARMDIGNDARRSAYWLTPRMQEILAFRRMRGQSISESTVRNRGQHHLLGAKNYPFDAFARELCDRLNAASGLEVRHPFYSARFIQFAFSTPERLRLRQDCEKYIHVEGMRGILPPVVAERRDKADFSSVFSDSLYRLEKELTERLPALRSSWVRPVGMSQLFNSYKESPRDGWQNWVLWNILACDVAVGRAI